MLIASSLGWRDDSRTQRSSSSISLPSRRGRFTTDLARHARAWPARDRSVTLAAGGGARGHAPRQALATSPLRRGPPAAWRIPAGPWLSARRSKASRGPLQSCRPRPPALRDPSRPGPALIARHRLALHQAPPRDRCAGPRRSRRSAGRRLRPPVLAAVRRVSAQAGRLRRRPARPARGAQRGYRGRFGGLHRVPRPTVSWPGQPVAWPGSMTPARAPAGRPGPAPSDPAFDALRRPSAAWAAWPRRLGHGCFISRAFHVAGPESASRAGIERSMQAVKIASRCSGAGLRST